MRKESPQPWKSGFLFSRLPLDPHLLRIYSTFSKTAGWKKTTLNLNAACHLPEMNDFDFRVMSTTDLIPPVHNLLSQLFVMQVNPQDGKKKIFGPFSFWSFDSLKRSKHCLVVM